MLERLASKSAFPGLAVALLRAVAVGACDKVDSDVALPEGSSGDADGGQTKLSRWM